MAQLNYTVLRESGYPGYILENAPEKVLQFGEGNFLRAFADEFFDLANEKLNWNGKVVLVQPNGSSLSDVINAQQGLYTLYLRGSQGGEHVERRRVISAVSRCLNPKSDWAQVLEFARSDALEIIISNTTEAGILHETESTFDQMPPRSFPAKLTRVLYERYAAGRHGVVILPCELIDNNGRELQRCVNRYIDDWQLPEGFRRWVNAENAFCSTLVDRIVPGRVRDPLALEALNAQNGYEDALIDVGELFGAWIIEAPNGPEGIAALEARLPFAAAGCPVQVVPDVSPYKKRKVRILNGAHTGFSLGAYLAGFDIVRDCMQDGTLLSFINRMLYDEVIPTLTLDLDDCRRFAAAVYDRFNNPFVNHELLSISLNSTAKWRARNLPTLLDYVEREGRLPPCLTASFAAYVAFCSSDIQTLSEAGLVCRRPRGNEYVVTDDREVLEFYYDHRDESPDSLVHAVMTNAEMWGRDLTRVPGFEAEAARILRRIRGDGSLAAFGDCLKQGSGDGNNR